MTNEEKEAKKRTDRLIDEMLAEQGLGAEAVLGKDGKLEEKSR